jgi:hypothetical protein
MALTVGTRLGPYVVEAPIGAGGMGEVYRARDTRLDRTVAIKVLPAELATDPGLRQRFDREARAISALNHPRICTLHDVGQEDGLAYLVMEYVDGESLAARLTRGALPLDQALEYGSAIADALDQAHTHGIVHRDLKPGNIMITKAGIKLLDFGLAKRHIEALLDGATRTTPVTSKGTLLGTVQYMAPEQLEGGDADTRSDIFAFGATLYEMLTGRRAFEGNSTASVIAAILDRTPAPIRTLQPKAPAVVEHLLDRCLAKNPAERWASAHDVRLELDWARTAREATTATAESRGRPRGVLAAIGAIVLVALGALAGRFLAAPPAGLVDGPTRLSIVVPEGTTIGSRYPLAISADARRVAYAAVRNHQQRIFVRDMEGFADVAVPDSEGGDCPFFSPDGRSIGFIVRGQVKKIALAAAGPASPVGITDALDATWAPDGSIIYSSSRTSGISRLDPSGTVKPLTTPDVRLEE